MDAEGLVVSCVLMMVVDEREAETVKGDVCLLGETECHFEGVESLEWEDGGGDEVVERWDIAVVFVF